MKRGSLLASLLVLLGIAGSATARFGFPEPVTERARLIEDIYVQITVAGIIVFLFVMALLGFILYRFREGGSGRATYEKERDNLKAEMVWTVIPLIIMLWIGVISYQGLVVLDDIDGSFDESSALHIDITASQYAWQAQYQESGASVLAVANFDFEQIKPFYVPADTPLMFHVTAVDVIHSFNVQALGHTIDAVPGQINDFIVHDGLPEGSYFTQCKENCRTPGHSYMQAQIVSVPVAEYQEWTDATLAGAAAGLEQVLPIVWDGSSFSAMKGTQVAKGATLHLEILNEADSAIDVTFQGETLTVPGKGLNTFEVTVDATGAMVVSGPGNFVLNAVEPTVIDVDLGAFIIEPGNMNLAAGTLYVINVENVHNAVHNLYIGMNGGDGETDAIWNTANLANGQSQGILIEATSAGSLEMWCAVPGHYAAGMFGTVTVA